VLAKLGISEKVARARAAAEWEEIVGPHIARVTGRVRVRGRTLLVEVKNAAWVAELSMMRRRLLDQLNAGKTRGKIEKIVFVQSGGDTGEDVNGDD
jgi:predicted nucleic acid-binding Zn ribbon protein